MEESRRRKDRVHACARPAGRAPGSRRRRARVPRDRGRPPGPARSALERARRALCDRQRSHGDRRQRRRAGRRQHRRAPRRRRAARGCPGAGDRPLADGPVRVARRPDARVDGRAARLEPAAGLSERGGRRIGAGVRGPPGARAAAARRRGDPRAHPAGRAQPCVPLAGAQSQPDQLVRRADRRARRRGAAATAAGARLPALPEPLPRRRAAARAGGGESRARAALPLPAVAAARRADQRRLGRVREHRARRLALLRRRARGGDAAPGACPAAAAAGVGAARRGRLLDTRRLSQLGHRLRLRALASDQEADARPADAHRARHGARAAAERPLGSVGAVDARPRPRPVRGPRRADPRAVGLRGPRRSRRRGAPPSSRPHAPR